MVMFTYVMTYDYTSRKHYRETTVTQQQFLTYFISFALQSAKNLLLITEEHKSAITVELHG